MRKRCCFTQSCNARKGRIAEKGLRLCVSSRLGVSCFDFIRRSLPLRTVAVQRSKSRFGCALPARAQPRPKLHLMPADKPRSPKPACRRRDRISLCLSVLRFAAVSGVKSAYELPRSWVFVDAESMEARWDGQARPNENVHRAPGPLVLQSLLCWSPAACRRR